MIELCYVSSANRCFNNDVLISLLKKARKNNLEEQVTGLLLYDGVGTFIQALEGEENTVKGLFERIKADKMHSQVNLLGIKDIEQRGFSDWQMGFRFINSECLTRQEISEIEGFSHFLEVSEEERLHQANSGFAMKMLYYFRDLARGESEAKDHI